MAPYKEPFLFMENQSKYDPSRKTVGAIYRDAQLNNTEKFVTNGDLTNELMSSLVEDINNTLNSKPYGDESFYLIVHEKKDLQMPNMILRRLLTMKKRPYPEDDTIVFWIEPKSGTCDFCWCLPHWSEMDNMLANENLYEKDMIAEIKAWKNIDLYYFGFCKDEIGNWIANPHYKNKKLKSNVQKPKVIVPIS